MRSTRTAQLATRRRCARSTPASGCTALPVTRCGAPTGDAAGGSSAAVQPSRRAALRLLPSLALAPHLAASLLPLLAAVPPAVAAQGAPSGFNAVKDTGKGYAFFYPVGWQEVALDGQDKAFKDVIEPLESVSLSVLPTTRASLAEAGSPQEVAQALVAKSASPQAKTALVSASQVRWRQTWATRLTPIMAALLTPFVGLSSTHTTHQRTDAAGATYYTFEFTSTARGVTRHAVTCLGVSNGKVFTLTAGTSQARWAKVGSKLTEVANSLVLLGY